MLVGKWSNFEELEDSLNLDELMSIVNAQQELEYRRNKFNASLQGVNLDSDEPEKEPVETVAEIMARLEEEQGLAPKESKEEKEFSEMGIRIVKGG